MNILKQALEAIDDARFTINRMQQRQPNVQYSQELLFGKLNAAALELRKAIAEQEAEAAKEGGTT